MRQIFSDLFGWCDSLHLKFGASKSDFQDSIDLVVLRRAWKGQKILVAYSSLVRMKNFCVDSKFAQFSLSNALDFDFSS